MGDGLTAGQRLGKFQLEQPLRAGGTGHVWAARDLDLGRKVALAVLSPEGAGAARVWAGVRHASVATVYDVAQADARDVLVMELVAGQSLASWLAAVRRDSWAIVDVLVAAGRGLAAAHAAGLVHRDVQPDRVLVEATGRVVVTDFGLARAGASAYVAPEQLSGAAPDERADQFAFCSMLWEALTGQRPFAGGVAAGPSLPIAIPPVLRAPLHRGLALDPRQRWPSVTALVDALEQAAAGARASSAGGGATRSAPRGVRGALVPILVAVGVGTAAACGAWVMLQRSAGRAPALAPAQLVGRPGVHETTVYVPPAAPYVPPHEYPSQISPPPPSPPPPPPPPHVTPRPNPYGP